MKGKVLHKMAHKKFLLSLLCAIVLSCSDEVGWNNQEPINFRDLTFDEELYGTGQDGFSEIFSTYSGVNASNDISEKEILENQHLMHGSGVALGDVNGDGLVDIYIPRIKEDNVLYINKGEWQFEDFTLVAGVAAPNRYSNGSVFADVDGDRDLDLIVTALGGPNSLFINDGNGIFVEKKLDSKLNNPGSTSSKVMFGTDSIAAVI